MKKTKLKTIVGASIVAVSISSAQTTDMKKSKTIRFDNIIYKIKDQTDNQDSISDGSKTERVSSK